MGYTKITELSSSYKHLEKMSIQEIIESINKEDKTIALAVEKQLPFINKMIAVIVTKLRDGGRLFYIGAGTSGRLGILDASECPPTFGVPDEMVIGLIAGGDIAIRKAVENAEDSTTQSWKDLQEYQISKQDVLIGIAASGSTPYVVAAIEKANAEGIETGCITMNEGSPLALVSKYPVVVTVGPEFVTGSSRMKAGTAQKMVLNMITTATMIQLGRVKGNRMVDMQLTNTKLVERGTLMIMESIPVEEDLARQLLLKYGSVREAILNYKNV
ncbi:MAG TPA: N-acetylmuramic acid 6-phosphate etherase [Lutibacter sp.]|nr:N-acetylmuramic acid 6-phosphate etherase [Lutibacter sp.]